MSFFKILITVIFFSINSVVLIGRHCSCSGFGGRFAVWAAVLWNSSVSLLFFVVVVVVYCCDQQVWINSATVFILLREKWAVAAVVVAVVEWIIDVCGIPGNRNFQSISDDPIHEMKLKFHRNWKPTHFPLPILMNIITSLQRHFY